MWVSSFRSSPVSPPTTSLLKLISRGLPVYSSSGTATDATNSNYDFALSSSGSPTTVAIDISSIVGAIVADGSNRKPLLVNLPSAGSGSFYTNNLTDYTIEVNAAAGGGSAPGSGWTTVVTVSSNPFATKAHLIDVAGKNWVRLNASAISTPSVKMDLFDASNCANAGFTAVNSGHILIGDSITWYGLSMDTQGYGTNPDIPAQIQTLRSSANVTTFVQNAGRPGWDVSTGAFGWLAVTSGGISDFERVVAQFPGKYVHILLGTNDANNGFSYSTYYTNGLVVMKDICVAYGKTMVVHTTPWGSLAGIVAGRGPIDTGNADIVTNFPGTVIVGSDRYTYYFNHQSEIGGDGVHPTPTGYINERVLVAARISAIGSGA